MKHNFKPSIPLGLKVMMFLCAFPMIKIDSWAAILQGNIQKFKNIINHKWITT